MVIPVVVAAGCATGPCWSWSSGLDVVVVVACSAAGIVSLITRQISKQRSRNQGLVHGSSDWDALIRINGDNLDDCVARAAKKGKQITGSAGQPAGLGTDRHCRKATSFLAPRQFRLPIQQ